MKTTVESNYVIGDRVYVPDLECFANILSIWIQKNGTSYEIAYFHAGDRKSCHVFDAEIRKGR